MPDVILRIVIASVEYDFQAVFNAAKTQIGDIADDRVFSTTGELTSAGSHRRSVVVALMVDDALSIRSEWLPVAADKSAQTMRDLLENLELSSEQKGLLLFIADGLSGRIRRNDPAPASRAATSWPAAWQPETCAWAARTSWAATAAARAAWQAPSSRGDPLKVGVGAAHGWHPVGASL